MGSYENYAKRFESAPWKPKEQRTVMANPPEGLTVTRDQMPERIVTEPSNVHLSIPKGQIDIPSMQKTRFVLPYVEDGAVLNHARVALTTSANKTDRERSYAQLKRMAAAGNESAVTMLAAFSQLCYEGLVIN